MYMRAARRNSINVVIPERSEAASPESITRIYLIQIPSVVMDSALACCARAPE
jgi:hypothetical protein